MAYLFTQGSCKKKEIYDLIVNSLLGAGWQNISSNVADGDVLISTGNTGDRSLIMQLFPYDAGYYGASAANYNNAAYSVRSGSSAVIGFRLPMSYTPGLDGAAGTVKRPSQNISRVAALNVASNSVDPEIEINYSIYVDKNRIILETKTSDILSAYCQLLHFGLPDTQYVKAKDARNMVLCSASGNAAANTLYSADFPDISLGSYGNWYTLQWNTIIPPRTPNVNNSFFLAEPYYQSAEVGVVGKIDGIYMLTTGSFINYGDIVMVGSSKFKTLVFPNQISSFTTGWPSTTALIQIS